MEAMRQSWSDDRLDDLNNRVDAGFARMDARFGQMEERMDTRFAQTEERMDARFAQMEERMDARSARLDAKIEKYFDRLDAKLDSKIDTTAVGLRQQMQADTHQLNSRFDAMQQTFIRVGGGLIGVMFASGAGLIATQL
jgi:hypothetical protein